MPQMSGETSSVQPRLSAYHSAHSASTGPLPDAHKNAITCKRARFTVCGGIRFIQTNCESTELHSNWIFGEIDSINAHTHTHNPLTSTFSMLEFPQ